MKDALNSLGNETKPNTPLKMYPHKRAIIKDIIAIMKNDAIKNNENSFS
jgi:hypothetical protein